MAKTKSEDVIVLLEHCIIYGLGFFLFNMNYLTFSYFAITHFFIDGITSQITKYFWNKGKTHNFFVTIGFDQFLHILIILFY